MIIAIAAACILASVLLWNVFRGSSTVPPSVATSSVQLPNLGIELDYPSNWRLQRFGDVVGHTFIEGALVSNVHHDFEHPDLGVNEGTSAWDMRGLPDELIVLSFEQSDHINFEAKRTKGFPLTLEAAVVSRDATDGVPTYGAPQPRYFLPFAVDGHLGSGVQVYFGNTDDRDLVERILASVRPID